MQSRSVPNRVAMADRPAGPMLIVVGGAPGTGKTTLARRIADELGLLLISRDAIKGPLENPDAPVLTVHTHEHAMPEIGTIRSFVSGTSTGR